MKAKQEAKLGVQKYPLSELFSQNQIVEWVSKNGQALFLFFLIFASLFFIGYRFAFNQIILSERHYITAENEYQRFFSEGNGLKDQVDLKKLELILNKSPELYSKYEGSIAQKLILDGNALESLSFAKNAIKRTEKENEPLFSTFSNTSLLSIQKEYSEALSQSLALKDKISQHPDHQSTKLLYAFNLLRIASLEQLLNLKEEEIKTWSEWKELANKNSADSKFQQLVNYFSIGKISLNDFIEEREKS